MDEQTLPSANLEPGEKLFGRYVLERKLGQGGMGVVWLAKDESLHRFTALKFLPDLVRQDRAAVDDLREETRRCLELTHPSIVRIYDFEEDERAAGISMEFVDGGTLASLRLEQPGKVFEPEQLLGWVRDLCTALHYAHTEARVVHRDLKPANLMVNQRDQLKVTDFGIARTITDSVTRVTGTEPTSGTLLYMSPQQAMGKPGASTDDVYSIGATLYELVTGKPPFFTGSIVAQLMSAVPPPMAERRQQFQVESKPIPELWERVIAACLAKEPEMRPPTALAVYEQLSGGGAPAASSSTSVAQPSGDALTPPTLLSAQSQRVWPLALIGGAACVAAGVWFYPPAREAVLGKADAPTPAPAPTPIVEAKVTPIPREGTLVINSAPSGASVLLDDELVGATPLSRARVPAGPHRLRFVLDGYEPQELALILAPGETHDTRAVPLVAKPKPPAPQPTPIVIERQVPVSVQAPMPAPVQQPSRVTSSGIWLFPDSSLRRLTRADMAGLSSDDIWRARNEIYARHGFIFNTDRGKAFARSLGEAYRPVSASDTQVFNRMNPTEQYNVEFLKSLQ